MSCIGQLENTLSLVIKVLWKTECITEISRTYDIVMMTYYKYIALIFSSLCLIFTYITNLLIICHLT